MLGLKESDIIRQALQDYQIPARDAKALLEKYPDILDRLRVSPYFLEDEIQSFTFPKCDKIAMENQYPFDGPDRIQHAMLYVLRQACYANGDCYMKAEDFSAAIKRLLSIRIDFRQAQAILNHHISPYIEQLGERIPVNIEELRDAIKKWQASRTKAPFSFVCREVDAIALGNALGILRNANRIVIEDDCVYLGSLYQSETFTAQRLRDLVKSEYQPFAGVEDILADICADEHLVLEKQQREAVLRCCNAHGGVFILNGRAGCGKTFTLNVIMKVLSRLYQNKHQVFTAKIMAPTGKAAQVAHQSTGLGACTVHRALHLVGDQVADNEVTINGDCIVIDEFSMMGIRLTEFLLRAVQIGTKVIIMGDFEQLPSIEPGNVLHDIIFSGVVPVITLTVVKRQAAGSGILYNANQILDGEAIHSNIVNPEGIKDNAYLFKSKTPTECRDSIVRMVQKMRATGFGLDDIQVLCPQKKTDIGIDSMNYYLQAALNPLRNQKEVLNKVILIHDESGMERNVKLMLREGDRVIHTSNDYDKVFYRFEKGRGFVEDLSRKGIVNGEVGRLAKIVVVKEKNTSHCRVYVRYGEQYALYEDDWSALSMAYAMTIHRAQGSQWPVVISPIMDCNHRMLSRKLFYTLYTRAQSTSIVYGTPKAIQYAISNNVTAARKTKLIERLQSTTPTL